MAINLEPAQGSPAPASGRLDRHGAEARQNRWMLQLERELLSANVKKQYDAAPQRHSNGQTQNDTGLKESLTTTIAAAQPGAACTLARPAGPFRFAAPTDGTDATADGVAQVRKEVSVLDQANRVTEPVETAAAAAGVASVQAPGVTGQAAPAGLKARIPDASVSAVAGATGGVALAKVRAAASADGVPPVQALERTVAAQNASLAASAELKAAEQDVRSSPELEGQKAGGSSARAADKVQEFDKRLMHLFAGPDGTYVYIRDAELGATQMRSLAVTLAAEMAASGQQLAALTVNGQRVVSHASSDASLAQADELAVPRNEGAAEGRTLQYTASVRKGTPS